MLSGFPLLLLLAGLGLVAWLAGRARANRFMAEGHKRINSLPSYHGWFTAMAALLPALIFLAVWQSVSPALVDQAVLESPAAAGIPQDDFRRNAILGEARSLAKNPSQQVFNDAARKIAPAYAEAQTWYGMIGLTGAFLLAFAGGAFAFLKLRPDFRARQQVERVVMGGLLLASLIAIFATIGIVASLIFETGRFFSMVSPADFLFGTHWAPSDKLGGSESGFGAVPLFWGTIFIGAIIAMIIAIPFGMMSAIYLTQYATPRVRSVMKPVLEVLAGVPTVVYGYFAALTIAPALRDIAVSLGISGASSESALAAGLVMGIMIIPFVSSMADDSIAAVPNSLRDGSLAMGATKSETIRQVLIPAALPGVVGGVLLAISRAIGETMIVVMAAGYAANLTANPFASITTVTVQIVALLTGDQKFDSPMTLAAFALGLVLFIVTLLLNLVAIMIVKRYREAYE